MCIQRKPVNDSDVEKSRNPRRIKRNIEKEEEKEMKNNPIKYLIIVIIDICRTYIECRGSFGNRIFFVYKKKRTVQKSAIDRHFISQPISHSHNYNPQ